MSKKSKKGMTIASSIYSALDRRWRASCRLLLGAEVGSLDEFSGWLSRDYEPLSTHKSSASGKDVPFVSPYYASGSKRISFDEVDFGKKFSPLTLNEMKDIDSIAQALGERAQYCGGQVLGNCGFVEGSTDITESFYVYKTAKVAFSKHIAYCTFGSISEDMFGVYSFGTSSHCIGGTSIMYSKRCLELSRSEYCSDVYFSHGLTSCSDCMFSFHLKNRKYAIGNCALSRDVYLKKKAELLSQMRSELESKKRLPSVLELFSGAHRPKKISGIKGMPSHENAASAKKAVDDGFAGACSAIFGQKLGAVDDYSKYLLKCVVGQKDAVSAGGSPLKVSQYAEFKRMAPPLLSQEEAAEYGQRAAIPESEALSLDFASVGEKVGKIAIFSPEWKVGHNQNCAMTPIFINASSIYKCVLAIESKNCAYSFLPRNSEYIYGSDVVRKSSHCIKCFDSSRLNRCFQADISNDCSDALFIHNCENVRDSMFCFNAKNLAHAIGNAALPLEQYKGIKASLVSQMAGELEKKHDMKWDIFTICSAPAHK